MYQNDTKATFAKMRNGRPLKARHAVAGQNLRQALMLLGKHWRKNTEDPDHVLKWDSWVVNGLPRSANTIDADVRLGIPEDRLDAYARCLGLAPSALASPATDIPRALSSASGEPDIDSLPVNFGYGEAFQKKYMGFNTAEYVSALFDLMGGVYTVYYVAPIFDVILKCCFFLYAADNAILRGRGLFHIYGLDNMTTVNIFRWHNNLHGLFHCHSMMEFGHYLVADPLRHHLVSRRDPFWLKGQGVSDNGQADNAPLTFTFLMEKLPQPEGLSGDAFYERQCNVLRGHPVIMPDDPQYRAVRERIDTATMF